MKSLFTVFFLAAFSFTAVGQLANGKEDVKQADVALNKLIVEKNSNKAAGFYAEEFLLTTSSGKQKRKQDILKEIASPTLTITTNETENVEIRIAGETAVLTGVLHQQGSYDGKAFDVRLLVTDTWIKTPTGWKILAGHASQIPKT